MTEKKMLRTWFCDEFLFFNIIRIVHSQFMNFISNLHINVCNLAIFYLFFIFISNWTTYIFKFLVTGRVDEDDFTAF